MMELEGSVTSEPGANREADLIAATPPDVLWRALFGFPANDSMFGDDTARVVAALAGAGGLPVTSRDEMTWWLPERLPVGAGDALSQVLNRALNLAQCDAIAEADLVEDAADPFKDVGDPIALRVEEEGLTNCLRVLLGMPGWWTAPKCPIVVANLPEHPLWRVGVRGFSPDLLFWRAQRAVEEALQAGEDEPVRLLDGPAGKPFRAALGPAPSGFASRLALARAEPYFGRSAAGWLTAAVGLALGQLPGRFLGGAGQDAFWQWAGTSRGGLGAACQRLSGSMLGALAERIVIAGPFEPGGAGRAAAMTFVRAKSGADSADPLKDFMIAAMRGEGVP